MRTQHNLLLAFFMLCFSLGMKAQSIVLCESYDESGNPSGVHTNWNVASDGGYIYILYKQPSNFTSGIWYLYIDQWDVSQNKYIPFETIPASDNITSWFVRDQFFTEAGDYKATMMFNGNAMASVEFDIAIDYTIASDTNKIDTYYYEDSEMRFCNSVDAGINLIGESTVFYLTSDSVIVTCYVANNNRPFKSEYVYVDIFNEEDDLFGEPTMSFTVNIEKDWDYFAFKTTFKEKGLYYVDIYNEEDIFINTASVTIE